MRYVTRIAATSAALVLALSSLAAARSSTHWVRVTPTSGGNLEEVSAVRTPDGVLHVVWSPYTPGATTNELLYTTISPGGTVGSTSTLASGWASIDDPAIARRSDGALVVVANAMRSTNASDPILNQAMWTSTDDGATWTLYPTDTAYQVSGGDPVSLAFGPDGTTPFATWDAIVHRGTDPMVGNVNLTESAGWNCCAYWGGIAFAPATNQLVVTWYSNATGHYGLAAQQIDPSNAAPIGSPVVMPGSTQIATDERTQVVARHGGGIYAADANGYPTATRALIWRYGAPRSTVVGSASAGISAVGVAADPGGRLWAFWFARSGDTTLVYARRSDPSGAHWGAAVVMRPPGGESDAWKLDGNGQAGKLDLLGLFTVNGTVATWDTQVLPGLSVSAKADHGGKLTVKVTDAGQGVSGATVRADGRSAKTNHSGVAHLSLGSHHPRSVKLSAVRSGYTTATARIRLPR